MPVRNAPSTIPASLRFIGARLSHRLRGGAQLPSSTDFWNRLDVALSAMSDVVERCDWIVVSGSAKDWTHTQLNLAANSAVSLMATGRVYMSRALDVGFGPQIGLWYQIGSAPLRNVSGGACHVEPATGTLRLTCKPSGEFADPDGSFDPAVPRQALAGAFLVAVIQWRGPLHAALQRAAQVDAALFAPLLQARPALPSGWNHLWRLGQSNIYRADPNKSSLCCHTHADVGIVQYPLHQALTAETTLDWSWCVEQLPSKLPEHTAPTHDYLSIAVEFDNGLDLTWMWSSELAVDTIFQCPLPWWDQRETHWVIRSGSEQLGQWLDERRSLLADYEKAIGGTPPKAVVAVWLISNSAFQRGVGRCRYRNISVRDGAARVDVKT